MSLWLIRLSYDNSLDVKPYEVINDILNPITFDDIYSSLDKIWGNPEKIKLECTYPIKEKSKKILFLLQLINSTYNI